MIDSAIECGEKQRQETEIMGEEYKVEHWEGDNESKRSGKGDNGDTKRMRMRMVEARGATGIGFSGSIQWFSGVVSR